MTAALLRRLARRTAVLTALAAVLVAVPAAAATPPVSNVASLHQEVRAGTLLATHGTKRVCPQCDAEIVTTAPGSTAVLSTSAPAGYSPAELASAYALPAGSTSTRTIAIIDAGVDATLAADLATYRAQFGLAPCTVADKCLTLQNYTGGAQPKPQTGADGEYVEEEVAGETSLDVDMASAACPSCHILEISIPWQDAIDDNDVTTGDFATAVDRAAKDGASAVSISYGYTPDVTNTRGAIRNSLTKPGVAIVASTGDNGFNGGIHQSWPADLPSVVAAGGISLTGPNTLSAWELGGSGCETDFPAANGQPAAVTKDCAHHRAASDVSADADPNTGVAVYDSDAPSSGQPADWAVLGGTSASAPYLAGLYARAGNLASVNGPNTLYAAPAKDFTDVTTGNNEIGGPACADYAGVSQSVCTAGPGWDGPTGLGVPHTLAAF